MSPAASPPYNFNIDDYLNRFIPRNRLSVLPTPISWFLGYRSKPQKPIGSLLVIWWSFLGAFVGLLVVHGFYMIPALSEDGESVVIASLGAAAILHFNTISSPLSQPRNAILGELISTTIGISITKLFLLAPGEYMHNLRFIAGALAVGLSSAAMGITGTIHPPAGATALLAATEPKIVKLGWKFLGYIVLGSTALVVVGLVVNNLQRQWPIYWWTAADLGEKQGDIEGVDGDEEEEEKMGDGRVVIDKKGIELPIGLELRYEERAVLEGIRQRLKEGGIWQGSRSRESGRADSEVTRVPDSDGSSPEITGGRGDR